MHLQPSIHRTLSAANLHKISRLWYPITPGQRGTSSGLTESQSHSCCLSVWGYTKAMSAPCLCEVIPKPFLLPARVGYTKAIPAHCPCGLYQSHSFSLPMWCFTKAISDPCVELYQSHSFTLWEREHVNILCYNLKALCSSVSLRSYCKIGNDCHLRRCTCIHTYTHSTCRNKNFLLFFISFET